jgi:quercetin dioxygenase-like cupin family protein
VSWQIIGRSVIGGSDPSRHPTSRLGWLAVFTLTRLRVAMVAGLLTAFALGVLLPGALAQDGSEPTALRSALARSSKVQGAPDRTMVLSKVVVEPGAELALHHHLGTQISRVVAGTLTYTVRQGTASLHEGDAEKNPRLVRTIKAGQTARIHPGQWLVEQPSDIHEAANRGSTPVVIYLATLLKAGAPPATPVALP